MKPDDTHEYRLNMLHLFWWIDADPDSKFSVFPVGVQNKGKPGEVVDLTKRSISERKTYVHGKGPKPRTHS